MLLVLLVESIHSLAQISPEHGLIIFPGGSLNCIGYWTVSISIIIILSMTMCILNLTRFFRYRHIIIFRLAHLKRIHTERSSALHTLDEGSAIFKMWVKTGIPVIPVTYLKITGICLFISFIHIKYHSIYFCTSYLQYNFSCIQWTDSWICTEKMINYIQYMNWNYLYNI